MSSDDTRIVPVGTTLLLCPVWHRPTSGTIRIVASGLDVRCRACHGTHVFPLAHLQREWALLADKDNCANDTNLL